LRAVGLGAELIELGLCEVDARMNAGEIGFGC
jgi:hypothetical protein